MNVTPNRNPFCLGLFVLLLSGAAVTAQTSPAADSTGKLMASGVETGKNLTLSVAKSADHTTLFRLLRASGLTDYSSGKGPYTVFAPSNEAFTAFSEAELSELLLPSSKKRLAQMLAYHVVKGRLTSDQLTDGQTLKNVLGQVLVIHKQEDRVTIEDARGTVATIVQSDIRTTNGVVYGIDKVLQTAVK